MALLMYISFLLLTVCMYIHAVVVDDEAVDEVINTGLRCHSTPGLAVAVVHNGSVVMARGFGVTNLDTQEPVTNTTLFGVASLTKAFTTTLLSKVLEEKSRYSVNTNLYRLLGRHKFNNTLRSVYATVEDLMAHRMGIPRNNYLRLDNTLTRQDLLRRMKYLKNVGGFRNSFYYNDLMYGLLALITERLTGGSWEDAMMEEIFTPLQMNMSTFCTRANFSSPGVATPYVTERDQLVEASADFLRHWALIGGSGSVMSNAVDMSKWMMFHLSGGKNQEGTQVVSGDLLKETYKPHNALPDNDINTYFRRPKTPVTMSNDGYGLGWKTGYYRGLKLLQHSGSTFGYRSFLSLLPDKKLGVFMAMTGTDDHYWFRGSLSAYLTDVFLGVTPWINKTTICTFPNLYTPTDRGREPQYSIQLHRNKRSRRHRHRDASYPLPSYGGTFRNEAYGNIYVHYDDSRHQLMAEYGIANWALDPRGGNKFRGSWQGPPPRLNFYFLFLVSDAQVYGLIPNFEKSSPQIFYRIQTNNIIN